MSETENEPEIGISDDKLPDDLKPGEDNPLAEGLGDDETVDDLLTGGKPAEESEDADDPEQAGPAQAQPEKAESGQAESDGSQQG